MNSGIYDISAEEYHRDPCPEPSLSASIIHTMLSCSPAHARHEHPRLNPDLVRKHSETFDLGIAAHAYLLEGRVGFVLIEARDFKTAAAQQARDAAYAAGKTPLLAHRWKEVMAMVEAINRQLDAQADKPRPFRDGKPEQTIIWREDDVYCRARLDWLRDDFTEIHDLKTTSASANPEQWSRALYGNGADVQAAYYRRGLKAVTGSDARFRFVVAENFAPYATSVMALGPMAMDLAEKKIRFALDLWARCLSTGDFPAYPQQTCYADLPAYEEARWIAREEASL